MPLLFNYKGKKYDIKDVIGEFDKDRCGNIIIRRDKDNQMVDKKGRRVNKKGYLIDNEGNIISSESGKIMFHAHMVSKDNEIPKLKNRFSLAYIHNSFADFMHFKGMVQDMP